MYKVVQRWKQGSYVRPWLLLTAQPPAKGQASLLPSEPKLSWVSEWGHEDLQDTCKINHWLDRRILPVKRAIQNKMEDEHSYFRARWWSRGEGLYVVIAPRYCPIAGWDLTQDRTQSGVL